MIERYELTEWEPPPPSPPLLNERARRWPWRFWLVALAMGLVWAFFIYAAFHLQALSVFPGLIVATLAMYGRAKFKSAGVDVRDLMDLPPVLPQFPVELIYSTCLAQYGRDVGVVTFVDDMMHFEGRKSRFSLPRGQFGIAPVKSGSSKAPFRYGIAFNHNQTPFEIALLCFDSVPGVGTGYHGRFQAVLAQFLMSPKARDRVALLPPLQPEPGTRMRTSISPALTGLALGVFLGMGIYGLAIDHGWETFWLVLYGVVGIFVMLAILRTNRRNANTLASFQLPSLDLIPVTEEATVEPAVQTSS